MFDIKHVPVTPYYLEMDIEGQKRPIYREREREREKYHTTHPAIFCKTCATGTNSTAKGRRSSIPANVG